MSTTDRVSTRNARTTWRVRASDVSKVVCHRNFKGSEQYLVRWRTEPEYPVPPRAILSWHCLDELSLALHHVQAYIEAQQQSKATSKADSYGSFDFGFGRKRKAVGGEPLSRDGLLTPDDSALGRSLSPAISTSSSSATENKPEPGVSVYNGFLEKKAGFFVAKKSKKGLKVDATQLPTPEMLRDAASAPVSEAERRIREAFLQKVKRVPRLFLNNNLDSSTPSVDFTFVQGYVLREGVHRADPGTYEGCSTPCKPNMGQHIGCESTKCGCLEYAGVDEEALRVKDPRLYDTYRRQKDQDVVFDTTGLPKRFPYTRPNANSQVPSTLQKFYRDSREPIFECNANCNCGPGCKNRLVQKGRKVPLTIFKTANRGWGVYCNEDLIMGEFIDTYLGEVITNKEASRREKRSGADKNSYLYSLDKHAVDAGVPGSGKDDQEDAEQSTDSSEEEEGDEDEEELTKKNCYVVDGQHMGTATRFINHSCEPNCRQYTVSYNKHDQRIYDLAFFACEDIPAGTELTFDYMDLNEEELEVVVKMREEAALKPENFGKKPCNCGAEKCRGYLW